MTDHTVAKRRGPKRTPLPERLAKYTVKDENGDCLLWTGTLSHNGYGRINVGRTTRPAHAIAFELAGGTVPEGYQLDHLCRVRNCVNPDHLEAVTPLENLRRSPYTLGSVEAAKTHCPQNHPYSPENTYALRGRRYCRACNAARGRAKRASRRALAAAGLAVMALVGLTSCHVNAWSTPGTTASTVR